MKNPTFRLQFFLSNQTNDTKHTVNQRAVGYSNARITREGMYLVRECRRELLIDRNTSVESSTYGSSIH